MIDAYWWRPTESLRSITSEIRHHGQAWQQLVKTSRRRPSNFGDDLNPIVLHHVFQVPIRWSRLSSASVCCIGSVLNSYLSVGSSALILGAGLRSADQEVRGLGHLSASAGGFVRGHLSARMLNRRSIEGVGDPGLLISDIFEFPSASRSQVPVLIPHFSDFASSANRGLMKLAISRGYKIIHPNSPPAEIAREIATSSYVLSASLHGLVFADSYGVPVTLIRFSEYESSFKYEDYSSIFGLPAVFVEARSAILGSESCQRDIAQHRAQCVSEQLIPIKQDIKTAMLSCRLRLGIG